MIHIEIPQREEEWFNYHIGRPSASRFSEIITTTGQPSKQRQKYLYTLAGEAVAGAKSGTYQSAAMFRGEAFEAEGIEFYAITHPEAVLSPVGVCLTDDEKVAASPDSFIDEDGQLELKCPMIHTHVEYLINGKLPTEYFTQVQGQLYVTGRKYCDFMSYYPGLDPLIIRVHPDYNFMTALHRELQRFNKDLELLIAKLKGEG